MNRQTYERLAVAFLLILFVFVLGNLIFNLENLYMGEERIPQFMPQSESEVDVATNDTLTNSGRWIYFGFMGFFVLVAIIGAASFGESKDKGKWRRLFIQMLALLLVMSVIFAFGHFYQNIENDMMDSGETGMLPGGGDGGVVNTGNATSEPPETPSTVKVLLTFGLFTMLFLICIAIVLAAINILKFRNVNLDYSDIERDKAEVAQTIQRTINAIAGGSDTRAMVIRCYTDMCKVMSKHGVKEEEHLTPREFKKLALEKLPVPEAQMRALIDVFEEARYSQHDLGKEHGTRAMKALEAVKEELLATEKPAQQGAA